VRHPKTQASRKERLADAVKYVGVGVGRRWNRSLMKAAAEKNKLGPIVAP